MPELDPSVCYVCCRKKKPTYANLGLCRFCYQSLVRTDGALSNRVASMMWAADRARKAQRKPSVKATKLLNKLIKTSKTPAPVDLSKLDPSFLAKVFAESGE